MPSLRQLFRPALRSAHNRLRFPGARIGACTYLSPGCQVRANTSLGGECRIFGAQLGPDTHLGNTVVIGHHARVTGCTIGDGCVIDPHAELHGCTLAASVSIQTRCTLSDVTIGRFSYVARETFLSGVTIGSFASIGPRTLLGFGDHPSNLVSTAPVFFSTRRQCGVSFAPSDHTAERRPIVLGHDVWLGAHVFVRDGVVVGDGAIVAAGAVVTADVPPYAIVGGVPAKIIRFRFGSDAIRRLQALQWWHSSEIRLRALQPWFAQPDITAFLHHAESL